MQVGSDGSGLTCSVVLFCPTAALVRRITTLGWKKQQLRRWKRANRWPCLLPSAVQSNRLFRWRNCLEWAELTRSLTGDVKLWQVMLLQQSGAFKCTVQDSRVPPGPPSALTRQAILSLKHLQPCNAPPVILV